MPPQLQLSLLNVPPAMDAIAALPRPQHVILNHIYLPARGARTPWLLPGPVACLLAAPCRWQLTPRSHCAWACRAPLAASLTAGRTSGAPPRSCLPHCWRPVAHTRPHCCSSHPGCNQPPCLQRMTTSTHAMVVGTTHRYRSKYVTTVM